MSGFLALPPRMHQAAREGGSDIPSPGSGKGKASERPLTGHPGFGARARHRAGFLGSQALCKPSPENTLLFSFRDGASSH